MCAFWRDAGLNSIRPFSFVCVVRWLARAHTHYFSEDCLQYVFVLQIVEEAGGRGAGQQAEFGHVGRLVGCPGDAQSKELDALVLGISNGRKNVWVSWVWNAVCEQHHHFDASNSGFLLVHLCHIGDCIGGVGAMSNVDYRPDPVLEVFGSPPVFEGLLLDNMTAVLKQGHPGSQAAAAWQPRSLESVHHVHCKTLFLLMIVFRALRTVQQEGKLQAAVFIQDGCEENNKTNLQ